MNANRISLLIPKPGEIEHWTYVNGGGGWDHPIHLHFEEGVTLNRGTDPIPATEKLVRKDVWRLGTAGQRQVTFQIQFGEYGGSYVNHCHNTVHEDFALQPAHAHLNLLGWVSLFLFGIFYHLHPALDRSRTAMVQVWIWIAATVILTIGVGLVHTGHEIGDPIAAVSSLVILADTLLFGWLVYRREAAEQAAGRTAIPAE